MFVYVVIIIQSNKYINLYYINITNTLLEKDHLKKKLSTIMMSTSSDIYDYISNSGNNEARPNVLYTVNVTVNVSVIFYKYIFEMSEHVEK